MLEDRIRTLNLVLTCYGVIRRSEWGAAASKIDASKPENLDWDYTTLVIHHSGRGAKSDPAAIQSLHMNKNGWDDIGYHFVVNASGQVYEGRSLVFKGSHVENGNTGKIGILVAGNFETAGFLGFLGGEPSSAQIEAVTQLGKWLKMLFPTVAKLGGHKDYKQGTECPGAAMYADIPALRKALNLTGP